MFKITEIVKDGILEIQFSGHGAGHKFYQIICSKGNVLQQGKITGFTQRTCLFIGDLKKGNYTLKLDETESKDFIVQ
jgi:hypothetical protein